MLCTSLHLRMAGVMLKPGSKQELFEHPVYQFWQEPWNWGPDVVLSVLAENRYGAGVQARRIGCGANANGHGTERSWAVLANKNPLLVGRCGVSSVFLLRVATTRGSAAGIKRSKKSGLKGKKIKLRARPFSLYIMKKQVWQRRWGSEAKNHTKTEVQWPKPK